MAAEKLIIACAESDDGAAWGEFVSRFHRPVSLSIVRTTNQWGGVPNQVIDDLVQETYLKLCADKCRTLRDFAVEHPEAIAAYIKTIAANVARDHLKALYSQKRGSGEAAQSIENIEPRARSESLGGQDATEREILLNQIDRCLKTCSEGRYQERDRLIFWLYYQQGLSAKAIAALPTVGMSAKGVESAILRLTRLVREQVAGSRSQTLAPRPGKKGFRSAESY